ncbi:MAG: AEC family transporter [Eubacteriales bacterium]|nr:AEC family transporter [Eubacteriales bacterium]MDY3332482.1 AEC family transporter [Gallibacter sp.]
MLLIFGRVLGIFLLIFVGLIAYKVGVFNEDSKNHLTKLLLYITAPCMAAYSIYSKEISPELMSSTIQVLIVQSLYFVVMVAFGYFVVRLLNFKPRAQWGVYIASMVAINNGFMGYPVTKAVFGDDIFYLMVMINIPSCIFFYAIMPVVMRIGRETTDTSWWSNIKQAINPAMTGIAIGVIFLLLGIQPPEDVNIIVKYLSDATIPLSMIIVGVQLGTSHLKEVIKNKYVAITSFVAMFVVPVVVLLLVHFLPFLNNDVKLIIIFSSIFPTAVVTAAISHQQGIEGNRAAEIVSITTAISLVTIPLSAAMLSYLYL